MRSKKLYFLSCVLTLAIIMFSASSRAAVEGYDAQNALSKILIEHDGMFFDAFNRCDLTKMAAFMAEDFEFYHDLGGLTDSKAKMMNMAKERCDRESESLRRELVEGSLTAFPLKGYGALQHGEHRFFLTPKDGSEKLIEIARFTSVWQNKEGQWQMTRVISYDHQAQH